VLTLSVPRLPTLFADEEYRQADQPRDGAPGAASRTVSAGESLARVTPYLADYGITRVADVTGLDRVGVPVHTALKPMGRTLSNGSGKGLTSEASKIGAMMEAIEQTCWELASFERVEATQSELLTEGIANADGDRLPQMKAALWNHQLPLYWTEMTDLMSGQVVLAPTEMLQAIANPRLTISTFVTATNGLASGNNVFEAILSSLNELIERDSAALAVARDPDKDYDQALDLDQLSATYGNPFHLVREQIERADLRLFVFDETDELGVPTFKAYAHDLAIVRAGSFAGYGTNLNPAVALCRAVTESMQSRALIIAGSRDDQFGSGRDASVLHSNHYAAPDPGRGNARGHDDASTGSILGDISVLVARLASAGMSQVLVKRYTQPGDPVQVVRVVVPGLEGIVFGHSTPGPRARAVMESLSAGAVA